MKTKRIIYFALMVVGALVMGYGKTFVKNEYALSAGIVLLMFGIYKSSRAWSISNSDEKGKEDE